MARVRELEATHEKALNKLVDDIYQRAFDYQWDWSELSRQSGLSYNTVVNLGQRITRFPQFRTVQLLAKAVGGDVRFVEVTSGGRVRGTTSRSIKVTWKPSKMGARSST